jgi:hypothetical protein
MSEIINISELPKAKRGRTKVLFAKFEQINEKTAVKLNTSEFAYSTVRYAVAKWNRNKPIKLELRQVKKTFVYVFLE